MAEQSWWQRLVAAVEREYERRIRRASLLGEFKPADDHHHAQVSAASTPDHAADEEEAVVVNVPRGTKISRRDANVEE
ncbi:hypothetical protein [Chloroflexus sp.]|uniref:hypothetical protein n=1 Tax=Chloroflexus sp. TaxID=1904827 RepID=UPI002ADD5088|nr:hypothetical protein [Chloroflexus sp.]